MSILERVQKENQFVEKTSVILDRLLDWQLERLKTNKSPSRETILREWVAFWNWQRKEKWMELQMEYFSISKVEC